MIRIIAKKYSEAVFSLCEKLDKESVDYDVYFSQNKQSLRDCLLKSTEISGLILVGNTVTLCELFSEALGLALLYDGFAEKQIREYCKLTNKAMPAQYILDKCCALPETFIHYASCCSEFQCACGGKVNNCNVYILPNNSKECKILFDEYIKTDLLRKNEEKKVICFKVFGLTDSETEDKLPSSKNKLFDISHQTLGLDGKITLTFDANCAKKIEEEIIQNISDNFSSYIYSRSNQTLAEKAVELLLNGNKALATAESITGGMIASAIVDVPGASGVLYEGAVTYSIAAKCSRLGISPHFIDEFGVVSPQVAREMALAQLSNADFSISTTGYAGPSSDDDMPVGLCYIGIASKTNGVRNVKVFRNIFDGERNCIRKSVTDTALFLLITALLDDDFLKNK